MKREWRGGKIVSLIWSINENALRPGGMHVPKLVSSAFDGSPNSVS